jgi:hypothetical protein
MTAHEDWVAAATQRLDAMQSSENESIPLDRMLGDSSDRDRAVADATIVYLALIELNSTRTAELMPRLVFVLHQSDHLSVDPPELSTLQTGLSEYEPPSVYLTKRNHLLGFEWFEEYRMPYWSEQPLQHAPGVAAYYSCYRDRLAYESGWEYSRAVWFEHHGSVA